MKNIRAYWPSLPVRQRWAVLFTLSGDGGRFHLPLRDSSGFTPDSLSCVLATQFTLPVKRTGNYKD